MEEKNRLSGMTGFTIVWFGQLISLLGSGMTVFAVSIWAWQETGQATALALAMFFGMGPSIFLSPVAGALVDRWDRKLVMILSDLAAGLSTVALLLLLLADQLELWHLYAANAFSGAFNAFQFPATSAAVTTMLPKKQYARASGMLSLAQSASGILAPISAGALIGFIGIGGIMGIDIVTFVFAISSLLIIHIPRPKESESGRDSRGSLWQESLYGFKYIFQRTSLLGLQLVFFMINLIAMFGFTVMVPMILARTGNDSLVLGSVQSIGSIGGLVGGLLLSVWGGPKRKVHGVLGGMIMESLFGLVLLGVGRTVGLWSAAWFLVGFFLPVLNGSNQAIWQAKVAPDVQGRVFAARRLIAQVAAPISILAAGPLADFVFEPAMVAGGRLANIFGWLVGTGPGAGMGLMFVFAGVLGALVGAGGYLFPAVRNAEEILPDHEVEEDLEMKPEPGVEPVAV